MEPRKLRVNFGMGRNGKVFTRIPEDGDYGDWQTRGKVYFPDRVFGDATPGIALVTVSKELEGCGFLQGYMEKLDKNTPTLKEAVDYGYKHLSVDCTLYMVESPVRGKYIVVKLWGNSLSHLVKDENGELTTGYCFENKDGFEWDCQNGYVTLEATLGDLWLADAFGENVQEAKETVRQMVDSWPAVMGKLMYKLGRTGHEFSDLIEDGISEGLVEAYELPGYGIVCLYPNKYFSDKALVKFDLEELRQMKDEVAKVNDEALERIKQACRRGRLRLE